MIPDPTGSRLRALLDEFQLKHDVMAGAPVYAFKWKNDFVRLRQDIDALLRPAEPQETEHASREIPSVAAPVSGAGARRATSVAVVDLVDQLEKKRFQMIMHGHSTCAADPWVVNWDDIIAVLGSLPAEPEEPQPLKRFVRHIPGCAVGFGQCEWREGDKEICTCGLAAALAASPSPQAHRLEYLLASLNVALWGQKGHTYPPGVVDRVLAWLRCHVCSPEDDPGENLNFPYQGCGE